MGENIQLLIKIQYQIIKARRMAAEIGDPSISRFLHDLADETEKRAREVDNDFERF
jgi:hypothetical protein